jgi:hypothetical protein
MMNATSRVHWVQKVQLTLTPFPLYLPPKLTTVRTSCTRCTQCTQCGQNHRRRVHAPVFGGVLAVPRRNTTVRSGLNYPFKVRREVRGC